MGGNDFDEKCSKALRLKCKNWDYWNKKHPNAKAFLVWVKSMVRQGYPVMICMFERGERLSHYDHIANVTAIESDYDDDQYHYNDIINIDEHYSNPMRLLFEDIQASRPAANRPNALKWSLPNDVINFGLAHTGPLGKDLLPVRLDASLEKEDPEIVDGSEKRPEAKPMTIIVTANGLQPEVKYNLYKYDDIEKVPVRHFNANQKSAAAVFSFTAESESYQIQEEIMTSD